MEGKMVIKGSIAALFLAASVSLSAAADNKVTASDNALMQRDNPAMPTRVLKEGTKINMHFGDTIIPGILNDGYTAQALIDRLPITVRLNRYSHDFAVLWKILFLIKKKMSILGG